jgi:hypothetical protein
MREPALLCIVVKEGLKAEGRCSACNLTITVYSRKRPVAEYLQEVFCEHIKTDYCRLNVECQETDVFSH